MVRSILELREGLTPVNTALSVRTVLVYEGELDMRIEADHAFDFVIPSSLLVNGIREK